MSNVNFLNRIATLSPSGQRHYLLYIQRFLADCLDTIPSEIDLGNLDGTSIVPHLTAPTLSVYLGKLKRSGQHLKPIQQTHSAVVMLAREFADEGLIGYDCVERLKTTSIPVAESGQDPVILLNQKLCNNLLQALYLLIKDDPQPLKMKYVRSFTLVLLMLVCGLQSNEIAHMDWADIKREGEYTLLRVYGKNSKLRTIKIPDVVMGALNYWRSLCGPGVNDSDSIFSALIWRQGVLSRVNRGIGSATILRLIKESGRLMDIPNLAPHDLRRSFVYNAYQAGASIEIIRQTLGHKNATTTRNLINASTILDNAAPDLVGNSLEISVNLKTAKADSETLPTESLLTRKEASQFLKLTLPQFDRLRKKHGVYATETCAGKTRPLTLFCHSDLEKLARMKQ